MKVVLITPEAYYGAMMDIVKDRRGTDIITQFLDDGQVVVVLHCVSIVCVVYVCVCSCIYVWVGVGVYMFMISFFFASFTIIIF